MTFTTANTAAELAAEYNRLSGKNIKPGSYSKAALLTFIEAFNATPAEEADQAAYPNNGTCPHCGIDYLDNGYQTHDNLISDGLPGNTTHDHICLACNREFGEELEAEFTLTEAAASIGISAKVARARFRAVDNDGKRTFYRFPRSQWNAVIAIISPKRKGA